MTEEVQKAREEADSAWAEANRLDREATEARKHAKAAEKRWTGLATKMEDDALETAQETRIWILGAPDPEMERIEKLLQAAGEVVVHFSIPGDSRRVRGGEAYSGESEVGAQRVYCVECAPEVASGKIIIIDHHRPGDPGYGRLPAEFWEASSIGQVVAELQRLGLSPEIREDYRYAAASDHCPAAAYRGLCPDIDPSHLSAWRVDTRAKFQHRAPADIEADIRAAIRAIEGAPLIDLHDPKWMPHDYDHDWSRSVCSGCAVDSVFVRDLRDRHVPEAPEASLRIAMPILCQGLPDSKFGRAKVNLLGDHEGTAVRAFLGGWAEQNGITDCYGDPMRGYAGGYLEKEDA